MADFFLKSFRLFRMLKIIKEKNKFLRYFNETFKLSAGFERFLGSLFTMLMICHLIACLFSILVDFIDSPINWINYFGFIDSSNFDVQNLSFFNF